MKKVTYLIVLALITVLASCFDDSEPLVVPKFAIEISPVRHYGMLEILSEEGDQILLSYQTPEGVTWNYTFSKEADDTWTCPDIPLFAYSDTLKFDATYKGMEPLWTAEASVAKHTIRMEGDKIVVDLKFEMPEVVKEPDNKPVPEGYDRAIYDREDLLRFMQEASGSYVAGNAGEEHIPKYVLDEKVIQMADVALEDGDFWTSIGYVRPFRGIYNGNGHKIVNMHTFSPGSPGGMFGKTEGATLCGINLQEYNQREDVKYFSGCLVGDASGSTITLCSSSGFIQGEYCVGGLVGRSVDNTISRCWSTATVYNSGLNQSHIGNTGGMVGSLESSSTLAGCYFTGSVEGTDSIGGLVGKMDNTSFVLSCYAGGEIVDTLMTGAKGGLIGKCDEPSNVRNSYASATYSGADPAFHELLSGASQSDSRCCWWPSLGGSPKDVVGKEDGNTVVRLPQIVVDGQGNYQALTVSTAEIDYRKYWDLTKEFPEIH